jgi:ubiquinone/menaquinone biosynthesis C-methylase UbiE
MRTLMDEFVSVLNFGASVVDLGCGAGRDLRALRTRDFSAIGVDWAFSIAAIARRYSGCPTVVGDLRELPFKDTAFDGAWASASLLHLRREEVTRALFEAWRVLKPGGLLFASVKEGTGERRDGEGRWFTFFKRAEWSDLLVTNGFIEQRTLSTRGLSGPKIDLASGASGLWITSFARRSPTLANRGDGNDQTIW